MRIHKIIAVHIGWNSPTGRHDYIQHYTHAHQSPWQHRNSYRSHTWTMTSYNSIVWLQHNIDLPIIYQPYVLITLKANANRLFFSFFFFLQESTMNTTIFGETTMIVHVCFDITWHNMVNKGGNHMYVESQYYDITVIQVDTKVTVITWYFSHNLRYYGNKGGNHMHMVSQYYGITMVFVNTIIVIPWYFLLTYAI